LSTSTGVAESEIAGIVAADFGHEVPPGADQLVAGQAQIEVQYSKMG
jgi:hypothetical protein